jgi:hypothetical protein
MISPNQRISQSARLELRAAQLACKVDGTPVTISYAYWPSGKPTPLANGRLVPTEANPKLSGSFSMKCFWHYISEAKSGLRIHAEVAVGDAIIDIVEPIIMVTSAGETNLVVGDLVGKWEFNEACRMAGVPATGTEVRLDSISGMESVVFSVDGVNWVQKTIGEALARSWNQSVQGITLGTAYLLTRST